MSPSRGVSPMSAVMWTSWWNWTTVGPSDDFIQMGLDLEALLSHTVDLVTIKGLSPHVKPYVDRDKQLSYARFTNASVALVPNAKSRLTAATSTYSTAP